MADNIEDFLRRAAERRQQRGKAAPPPPPQAQPPRNQQPQRPAAPPPQPAQYQSAPQPIQQPSVQPPRQTKKQKREQFQTNVETRQKLAQSVETADDTMRDHLSSVFAHQLGNIASNKPISAVTTQSPKPDDAKSEGSLSQESPNDSLAQQLLAALRDPKTTKLAFIASEVFQRRF